ncbi:autotransporter outer membrane beta-barrel domain-containing protein [Selenomonas sp. F0473]|uniref:autotransporter outer membrane beta-barrel domain-containing protein n=1 Tax=Selenomonas sp. F0473 TaxID=999423 RepID=UPI0012EAEF66|nr:autotransporter outer membrane beta-barrel domain-containing protein [Selenomonas sp. F0473]
MNSYFSKGRRLRLSALVFGSLLWSATAGAAALVSTIPSDYGNSEMGAVNGSRVTTEIDGTPMVGVYKGLNRDPASFNFHQRGKSKIFMRQYTYSTTELEANMLLDPNSSGAAAMEAAGKIEAVPNAHAAAASDNYIYVTGYDLGKIGVAQQRGAVLRENKRAAVDLKEDIKKYCGYNFNETFRNEDDDKTYTGDPNLARVHGEALLVVGRKLYVATSVNPLANYDPYDDGFLMQYDIQDDGSLKFGSYTRISRNIDQGRLNKFNDYIMVSCIGGYQHYDGKGNVHYTAVNVAQVDENGKLTSTAQRRINVPDQVKATGQDFRDVKTLPNGTAYVMTYNLNPNGSQIDAKVYQTTVSNLLSDHPEDWTEIVSVTQEEGWFGKLNAEYYTKRLWLELGDTLRAYTDGDAVEKYKWQAKDFSENKSFSRFNKITMLEPDHVYGPTASVVLALPAELGGTTATPAANPHAVWQNGSATAPVTASQNYSADTLINIGRDRIGNASTNVLAGIYAAGKNIDINAAGHRLQLQTENTVGNPTGIYAGKGKNVTVNASEVNIITRGWKNGNTLTNAIQLDAAKNKAGQITINAPVNISMSGGYGGNGVAVQKSDRLGEKSYEASAHSNILINGDLKIAGARTDEWGIPINRENVFSRFNNAGILTQVEKSNVTVNGNVDMTVYGNGVTTNAKDSTVHIGGGSIQVPAGMAYSYYALAAYQGAISMNTGTDGKTPGTRDVRLDGDLFALSTGKLNVALTTNNSYLHGLVDSGGTANLYLQNGAKWLNEGRNARYYQDNEDMGAGTMVKSRAAANYVGRSRVTNFYGGADEASRGIIYQKDADALTIDNYSGHTAAIYAHDAASPTVIRGGDIVVGKAVGTENVFTLFTDVDGVTKDNQKDVLGALANKLTYKNYTDGRLTGKLAIGEGLTMSSINQYITFGGEKGAYDPSDPRNKGEEPQPKPPANEQTKTEFTTPITHEAGQEYVDDHVAQAGNHYKFTKDTTVNLTKDKDREGIGNNSTDGSGLVVDAGGHNLDVSVRGQNLRTGIKNSSDGGITITANRLRVNAASDNFRAYGIWNNQSGSTVRVNGNLVLNINAKLTGQGLFASRGAAIETDGVEVNINKDAAAAWSVYNNDGTITVNERGKGDVILNGNIYSGPESHTNLTLTTENSVLNGVIHQAVPEEEDDEYDAFYSAPASALMRSGAARGVNLTLANGAVWNNADYNATNKALSDATFMGSTLASLTGGKDAAKAGIIRQNDTNQLTIENYNGGYLNIDYAHDAATPTAFSSGDTIINRAADGSFVTLRTDHAGVTAANQLDVLSALAKKLTYKSYKDNKLTGKLQIAEGATTSAINQYITFNSVKGAYDPNDPRNGETPPPPPEEQTETEFTTRLFGSESKDKAYVDAHVRQADDTYRFTKDSTISYANTDNEDAGVITPTEDVRLDASTHTLTVETKVHGAQKAAAIKNTGKKLNITADTLRLLTNKNEVSDALNSWGILNESGTTNVSGLTEIDATGYESSRAVEATEGTVTLEGLKAKVATYDDATALFTGSTGQIYVNAKDGSAGSHTVKLDGNVGAMGEASRIDVAMVNKDSGVNGLAFGKGKINFWLQNGAVWNNEQYGGTVPDKEDNQLGYDYDYTFAGSRLASLKGGSNANNAGAIFQKNAKDITIDNYSGHTRVFYAHDAATPTTMIGGDFRIKNAAAGSAITLTTDSVGLNTESTKAVDKNRVSATLNALANKLWYTAYTTGERNLTGKAEIAEGLTTSAASKRIEDITFDTASGQGSYVYTPASEVTTDPITESETLTYDRQAIATQPNTKGNRIVSALYTDNTAYDKQHPMVVDMNGHSLHLEANSKNQISSAIYGGNNKSIRIVNSGEEKALTIKASNTDTRAATGIQSDANSHIYIQGPVVIEDVHAKGYNATAIQTSGTIGSPSDVTIDGDLTVQSIRADRVDPKHTADDGRNLAALKTTGNETKITVKGNVDIQNIKGSVLQTVGADSVIDVGGGTISAAEDADHTKQYYAVHATKGTVNINAAGDKKTNITGDMYLTREYGKKVAEYSGGKLVDFSSGGTLSASLTTADSSWHGAALYAVDRKDLGTGGFTAHDVGQFNLTLANGAAWTNELKSSADASWQGSRLAKLAGGADAAHAGLIFQKNDKDITIDNYSGHTRVFYAHDADSPTAISGGDLRINKAAADSGVTMVTDNTGLNTASETAADKNLVSATLNALANKLWYTGYVSGERNLLGKVEIAEGLTASSASKRVENITFDSATGRGGYVYTPAQPGQTATEFTTPLTGDADADEEYVDAQVRQDDGSYRFTKDTTITYQKNSRDGVIRPKKGLDIDASGRVLTITTDGAEERATEAAGIMLAPTHKLNIKAGTLRLLVTDKNSKDHLENAYGIRGYKGTLSIAGMTEIEVGGTEISHGVHAYDDTMTLDGLSAKVNTAAKDSAALYACYGRINVNVKNGTASDSAVRLDGNVVSKDAQGRIDVAFTGPSSYLKGLAFGDGTINMWLQNGAAWNNINGAAASPQGYWGSRVASLVGGSSPDRAGLIFQNEANPIVADQYSGYTRVFYKHDAAVPKKIIGGALLINHAAAGSGVTVATDNTGLNTDAAASAAEKKLVDETLGALANKLWYRAYKDGERNLTGKVEIAEGLTGSSASKRIENITFDAETGKGTYGTPTVTEQTKTTFTTGIVGEAAHDAEYTEAGVRQEDGSYVFTKDTVIAPGVTEIKAGAWLGTFSAAVSNSDIKNPVNIDLRGRNLTVNTKTDMSTVGITAIGNGAQLNIENAGAITVNAENTSSSQTAAVYANSGGKVHIKNGGGDLESKVLKVRANNADGKTNVAVIKTMNGVPGARSNITIDGLVDVLADGGAKGTKKGANEAVSAVASTIDIGGGTIKAVGDAWAAIRAYGEFVTQNTGVVNFNVTKDANGVATGAGTNRAVIEGDFSTNGGMGTKGRINVGLSTAGSYWLGNYVDSHGYGVTQGQDGVVNLFMKNGAYWKGFSIGVMNVEMSGANTRWIGFNVEKSLKLSLNDGATWYNAITPEQKGWKGVDAISRVKDFSGSGGFIDMTGTNRFLGEGNSLDQTGVPGAAVQSKCSSITEKGLGETGDLEIDNFSGSTTINYRHDAAAPTTIYGGRTTINKAAAGSSVTMRTDNIGLNTESKKAADKNLVSATLNALANKLWYTGYVSGERNLLGKAEIAEGLTTSSASKRVESITFNETSGQGGYVYTPAQDEPEEQSKTAFTKRIFGSTDQEYVDAHVKQADGTYRFTKDSTINYQSGSNMNAGAIAPNYDTKIDASGRTLTVNTSGKTANVKEIAAIKSANGKTLDIKAGTLRLLANDAAAESAWGVWNIGGTTTIAGMTEIDVAGTQNSKAVQASGGSISLEGLHAKTAAGAAESAALFAGKDGRINVNVKDDTVGSCSVTLDGNITAKDAASRVDAALTGANSYWKGISSGDGSVNLWLQNGAAWTNEAYGTAPTGFTGSRLAKLTGGSDAAHAGVIFQKNDKDIAIDNYSGHTRVFYGHDAASPTTISGGNLKIAKATVDSGVTMVTDNAGLNTESAKAANKNLVSATLNALANKLWYTGYVSGERNLLGKVEIAEGLTASSASKRVENITFDSATGKGGYVYTPAQDEPEEQSKTEFTKRIFGSTDQEYVDAHVKQADGTYRFTKDSTINYQSGSNMNAGAIAPNHDVKIDASGRTLTVNTSGKTASVKEIAAIKSSAGKALDIKAGTLRLLANDAAAESAWGIWNIGGTTTIAGMTEIDVAGTKNSKAVQASGGTISLEGLHAKTAAGAAESAALFADKDGRISVNVKDSAVGSGNVTLDGSITAKDAVSRVDAALTGTNSYWKGLASGAGSVNLWLQNGAAWTNEAYGSMPNGFTGSRLAKLTGGHDAAHAGLIFQKNDKDITIDNYSGHTRVFYGHDAAFPTKIYGGSVKINKAAAGSTITLRTDSNGLNTASTKAADRNLVSATLNALANKLYYTAYTTGERNLTGKTEIAEGLTTSSVSHSENITFNETTGQGGYAYKPSIDIPDTQVTTAFTQGITGDADQDEVYATGGVLKNGKYYFSKTTDITADSGITASQGKPIDITGGSGTKLTINAKNYGIDAGANSKVDITGDRMAINATGGKDSRSIRAAAGSSVTLLSGFDIKGAIENNGGTVKLDGTGKTSSLVGNITQNDGTFNLRMTGKNSVLKSDIISKGGNLAVTLDGEGTVFTGSIGAAAKSGASFYRAGVPTGTRELTLGRTAVWNVTGASDLTKLSAQGTIVQQSNQEVRIGDYEGTAKVLYRGTATSDGVLTLGNTGRFTVQNIIGANNSLTLATDAFSGNDAGDEKVAETLAKRFVYSGDSGNIENEGVKGLRLNAAIADGMTTSAKTYRVRLGANGLSQGVTRVALSDIQYGDYETKLMSGVKSAMTASTMAWRAESNDLMKRLGDLRLSPEKLGTWVRFYRGKASSDKDRADFHMNYTTIQVGHDWKVSPAWRVGLAGSYMKGSSSYASGSGKNKEGNLGVYGTWTGKGGQYVDLIAKVGRLTNEYSVYNDFGHYVKGDYGAWGGSLSAEYGKRIRAKNSGFIEPQAELIYTHLNGANYAGSTDYMVGGVYQKMYVRQGAFNSLIGRLGIGFGRETNRSTWFAKVSLYHAFSGSLHTDYSDGINPWKHTHQDFKDTWVGAQLGGTLKLSDKTSLYGNFEKTFGGDIKTDWRMDAGVRWSF